MPDQVPDSNVVEFSRTRPYLEPPSVNQTTTGGGSGGSMEQMIPIKEYVDARDDAVESRLQQRLDKLSTKTTVWQAAATIIGLLLAALAFGGDRFDGGVGASVLLREQAEKQAKTDQAQDAKLEQMNGKLDILIKQTSMK
jgi:hypothetical protein